MATTVTQIHTNLKNAIAAILGPTFHELTDSVNLLANNLRVAKKGYAVKHGAVSSAPGTTRAYTTDQSFEVILTDTNPRRNDDSALQTALNALYDLADQILVEIFRTKLNMSGVVLNVEKPGMDRPEFINGKEFIVLRFRIIVKYRNGVA